MFYFLYTILGRAPQEESGLVGVSSVECPHNGPRLEYLLCARLDVALRSPG